MAYRNKTYVAFDADSDIHYYRLMQAWKENDKIDFNFHNAHDINSNPDLQDAQKIKRDLKIRFENTKIFILLVGDKTKNLHTFVTWEIDEALDRNLPIIVVNLNGKKTLDDNLCPPRLQDKLALHINFGQKIIQHAMDEWEEAHYRHKMNNKSGPFTYPSSLYEKLC